MTVDQFAKLLGTHPDTLYLYESGKQIPNIETLLRICNALKIPTSRIFHDEGQSDLDVDPIRKNKSKK